MPTYSFARVADGAFTGRRFSGPTEMLGLNTPLGCLGVEGVYDELEHRVDLQASEFDKEAQLIRAVVVDYQPPKPTDTEWETFHWRERRWMAEPTTAAHWRSVRSSRDALLAACDWVVTKAAEAGKPVPAPWVAYRQMLRDITLQPDPLNIHWPDEP